MPSREQPDEIIEESGPDEKFARGAFQRFLARPDKPLLSYKEQGELKKIGQFQSEEDAKKFAESKKDKFHTSAVSPVLIAAEMYLDSKSNKFPPDLTETMRGRIMNLNREFAESREREHMSQEFMDRVIAFVKEFESHL